MTKDTFGKVHRKILKYNNIDFKGQTFGNFWRVMKQCYPEWNLNENTIVIEESIPLLDKKYKRILAEENKQGDLK